MFTATFLPLRRFSLTLKDKAWKRYSTAGILLDKALRYGLTTTKTVVVNGKIKMTQCTFNTQKLEDAIRSEVEK
jgi:hypothetical protein